MPPLHQHVGRHHGAPVRRPHHGGVVARPEFHRRGLLTAAHQSVDDGELAEVGHGFDRFSTHHGASLATIVVS
jgi:hypothetical protein